MSDKMEDLLERFRTENARLRRQEIKDLLPTSLVSCPVCGISGVRPRDKMCDKCRIEELQAENKKLREALEPFANFACDDWKTHKCFNCIAKQALKGQTND